MSKASLFSFLLPPKQYRHWTPISSRKLFALDTCKYRQKKQRIGKISEKRAQPVRLRSHPRVKTGFNWILSWPDRELDGSPNARSGREPGIDKRPNHPLQGAADDAPRLGRAEREFGGFGPALENSCHVCFRRARRFGIGFRSVFCEHHR